MKSGFALYQALRSIDVPDDKATAVVDAMESDMQTHLATKADLAQLELKLTIRMGVMISTAVGIMLTAMKFMH
ncbi:hypothetical protein [Pseudomonas oryzihabitans]|uniref:hypothetical protein n=1 Tax=Pseudomonas oryzihabitans TaxID=47885 RepID=UPI0011A0A3F4|nr:hypothetical protein [Pseudomonas psychrotolerans]